MVGLGIELRCEPLDAFARDQLFGALEAHTEREIIEPLYHGPAPIVAARPRRENARATSLQHWSRRCDLRRWNSTPSTIPCELSIHHPTVANSPAPAGNAPLSAPHPPRD